MEIKQAQDEVEKIIKFYGEYWPQLSQFARLAEEVGELGRALNIKYGGKKAKNENDGREIAEELVDVIFTAIAIANNEGIDLTEEFKNKVEKDWDKMKGVYVKGE